MNTAKTSETLLLDNTYTRLQQGDVVGAMSHLAGSLIDMRLRMGREDWLEFARNELPQHPVTELIHQDPATRRSFLKPRGYAGDAVLLDYLYGLLIPGEETTALGKQVQRYLWGTAASRAVRNRAEYLAERIDRCADATQARGRILSIAAGHLREAEMTASVPHGWFQRFVALDVDEDSLSEIDQRDLGVETVRMSVGRLMTGRQHLGDFDLIYSAGLYDYLDTRSGRALTRHLFAQLAPGGTLALTNFLPSAASAGYMETFMGWELIFRDLSQIRDLLGNIAPEEIGSVRCFADSYGEIGYLEVTRRG